MIFAVPPKQRSRAKMTPEERKRRRQEILAGNLKKKELEVACRLADAPRVPLDSFRSA